MTDPTSDLWTRLVHDWPGAAAGVSQRGPHDPAVPWSGYNLGHTDRADHAAVDALRRRALTELGAPQAQIVCAYQVHGRHVTAVRAADLPSQPDFYGYPQVSATDALITAEPGLALTLFYADCCPIILYSPDPLCGGVAHAGWRGSVADMAGSVVGALQHEFSARPDTLQALVGPYIGVECYEVGSEVVKAVEGLGMAQTLQRYGDSIHLDLLSLNVALLQRAGLPTTNIQSVPHCTRCGPVPLYSWRRDGPTCGRMAAMFVLL
jgi:polyphenol oxidase